MSWKQEFETEKNSLSLPKQANASEEMLKLSPEYVQSQATFGVLLKEVKNFVNEVNNCTKFYTLEILKSGMELSGDGLVTVGLRDSEDRNGSTVSFYTYITIKNMTNIFLQLGAKVKGSDPYKEPCADIRDALKKLLVYVVQKEEFGPGDRWDGL